MKLNDFVIWTKASPMDLCKKSLNKQIWRRYYDIAARNLKTPKHGVDASLSPLLTAVWCWSYKTLHLILFTRLCWSYNTVQIKTTPYNIYLILITITDRGVVLRSRSSDRGILLNLQQQLPENHKPQHFLNNRSTQPFLNPREMNPMICINVYEGTFITKVSEVFRGFSIQLTFSWFPSHHPSPLVFNPWDSLPTVIFCLQTLLWFGVTCLSRMT